MPPPLLLWLGGNGSDTAPVIKKFKKKVKSMQLKIQLIFKFHLVLFTFVLSHLGERGFQLPNVVPHCIWRYAASDMNGVWQILHNIDKTMNNASLKCLCFHLKIHKSNSKYETEIITSFRCSNDPDTRYALVTNLATDCMLINPFQIFSWPWRKIAVSPSAGGSDVL